MADLDDGLGAGKLRNGVHDLYVVFKAPPSGTSALGNLNWFQFN